MIDLKPLFGKYKTSFPFLLRIQFVHAFGYDFLSRFYYSQSQKPLILGNNDSEVVKHYCATCNAEQDHIVTDNSGIFLGLPDNHVAMQHTCVFCGWGRHHIHKGTVADNNINLNLIKIPTIFEVERDV